eukprot:m.46506 g.46506  ORF g.46506 m.46506 type:complete len:91 (-) comp8773_c0_seq1:1105-1377(-)
MSEKCHSILALLSVAAIFGGCIFVGQRRFATMVCSPSSPEIVFDGAFVAQPLTSTRDGHTIDQTCVHRVHSSQHCQVNNAFPALRALHSP